MPDNDVLSRCLDDDSDGGRSDFNPHVPPPKTVTQISGRGAGMDIVQDQVIKRGGTAAIAYTGPKTNKGRRPFKLVLALPSQIALVTETADFKIAS